MKLLAQVSAVVTLLTIQLPAIATGEAAYAALAAKDTDVVVFNPRSLKYHIASCGAASRCTHCVSITRKEAKAQGGVPCKLCGAGE